MFPQILRPLLRAAPIVKFTPSETRSVRECLCAPVSFWPGQNSGRATHEVQVLRRFAGKFHNAVKREGFATPDGTLGIEVTGTLDERLFQAIARSIPDGTWEFVCHPGYNDADLRSADTRLRESRETELHVLTLPGARDLLAKEGVELISYRDLSHAT